MSGDGCCCIVMFLAVIGIVILDRGINGDSHSAVTYIVGILLLMPCMVVMLIFIYFQLEDCIGCNRRSTVVNHPIVVEPQINDIKVEINISPQHSAKYNTPKYLHYNISRNIDNKNMECSICLVEFQKTDMVYLTPCCHIYHIHCLDKWLNNHDNCPICMNKLSVVI